MRIITLLAAATMGGMLAACSTVTVPTDPKLIVGHPPPPSTLSNTVKCPDPDCKVKVEVIGDCKFNVPDLVVLSGMRGKRHSVMWQILSPDYVFPRTGTPALDPKGSGEFFGPPGVAGPIMVVDVVVGTPGLSHEYGLNIVKRSGGTVCPKVDPYMIE
jgi:hypothetical protein